MIKMNRAIFKGEDYKNDYKTLCRDLMKAIDLYPLEKIKQVGNYLNFVAVFDSESANYSDEQGKKPYLISEAMTFLNLDNNENVNLLFRHLPEYEKFMRTFSKFLNLYVKGEPLRNASGDIVKDVYGHVIYDTKSDLYLNVYVHNLPFDASFLLPVEDVFQLFAADLHKPYYYITSSGFRYVDTAVLTQNSLAGLGKKLRRFDVKKMVGDFDYDKIRTPETPFTEKEIGYVLNDVLVLSAYIAEFCQDNYDSDLSRLPLTQTGIVRSFLRNAYNGDKATYYQLFKDRIIKRSVILKAFTKAVEECKSARTFKTRNGFTTKQAVNALYQAFSKGRFQGVKTDRRRNYEALKASLQVLGGKRDEYTYSFNAFKMMKDAYAGGFTHSNAAHTNRVLEKVHSFDFTSSYPTRILSQLFASSYPVPLTENDLGQLPTLMSKAITKDRLLSKLYLFTAKADDLKVKDGVQDGYLSSYHIKADDIYESNGRVLSAKNVVFTTSSIDWEILGKVYDFTNLKFVKGYSFEQSYLPPYLLYSTIYFYASKTKLKHVKGREADYMRSKQMLNSCYGCMVSDLVRPGIYYTNKDGWIKNDYYKQESENKDEHDLAVKAEEKNRQDFLYYVWGVEVSAYARVALWRGILSVGSDYVYSDTDSLKVLNKQDHLKEIDKENKIIVSQIDKCLSSVGVSPEMARPRDIKGNRHQLGIWDVDDGSYSYFKTLGAKRYVVITNDGNFEITIAGLNKKIGARYILKGSKAKFKTSKKGDLKPLLTKSNISKIFNFFTNEMYVPTSSTGKLASYYVDHYPSFNVKNAKIPAGGGCFLKPVDFTMSLSVSFEAILDVIFSGYVISKNVL